MRPEPTEQELRTAWMHCVRHARSPWPASFEEAMADPTLSRLVRLTAIHPPRPQRRPVAIARAPRPVNLPAIARNHFDRKRAAAGDRDDD